MNVITCLQPVNQNFNLKKQKVSKYRKRELTNQFGNIFYFTSLFMLPLIIILFCVAYFPILRLNLKTSVIQDISFWDEPSAKKAMNDFFMPIGKKTSVSTELVANIQDIVSVVEFQNYTVKRGDTISGIAQKFKLNNMGTILSINKIERAKRLQVGQHLKIPCIDGIIYTVKKGDSLSSVSSKFKLPLTTILDANDLEDQSISIGQALFIPGAVISNFQLKKALGELFIYPIKGRLTSPFGYRFDPFTGRKSFHSGIDLASPKGTSIKVTMDGKVAFVGTSPIFGKYIIISHSGGYQSMYGHLSKVSVKRGQQVKQGKKIGEVGSSGRSTGPHVHFSVYKNGKLINPLGVLK